MKIRKATITDSQIIVDFMMELRKIEHSLTDFVNTGKKTRDFLLNDFVLKRLENKDYYFFIAEEQNKPIGLIVGWKEFISPVYKNENVLYLCDAIINPKFRGKGVGKKLTQHLEKEAKKNGLKESVLEVLIDNSNSVNFWKKLGYQEIYLKMRKKI